MSGSKGAAGAGKKYWVLIFICFCALAAEFLYFAFTYRALNPAPPPEFDLVLKYTDSGSLKFPLYLAEHFHKPLYISKAPWENGKFYRKIPKGLGVFVDSSGRTTDANARHSAPFIRSHGFKRVLLVTSWVHAPRALFLTRFYLWGSGVSVIACPGESVPANWWRQMGFWMESVKFWGSLGRVVLASAPFEWETGPDGRKLK